MIGANLEPIVSFSVSPNLFLSLSLTLFVSHSLFLFVFLFFSVTHTHTLCLFFFASLFVSLTPHHVSSLPLCLSPFFLRSTDEQLQEMTSPANYNRYKEISRPNVNKIVKLGMAFRGTSVHQSTRIRIHKIATSSRLPYLNFSDDELFYFVFLLLLSLIYYTSSRFFTFSISLDIAEKEKCVVSDAEVKEQLDVLIIQVRPFLLSLARSS